jgi:hypothetical protein
MAEQVTGDEPGRVVDRAPPIESIEKRRLQGIAVARQVIQRVAPLARKRRRRNIEKADEIDAHRPVEAPRSQRGSIGTSRSEPLPHTRFSIP